MEAHLCNHPKVPHTVWWWPHDEVVAPSSRTFDDLEDADHFAQRLIRSNNERIDWLKIFRSDNESYTCYTWKNTKEDKLDAQQVKLEVDMAPFQEVFDNVAKGFEEQGKAILRLKISQAITIVLLVLDAVGHLT